MKHRVTMSPKYGTIVIMMQANNFANLTILMHIQAQNVSYVNFLMLFPAVGVFEAYLKHH